MAVLRLNNVSKKYTAKATSSWAVQNIDLYVDPQETVTLIGPSGSGKSTILKQALLLENKDSGTVEWQGQRVCNLRRRSLRPLRQKMQIIFQDSVSTIDERLQIRQLLLQPLIFHNVPKVEWDARLSEVMAWVGLDPSLLERKPHDLSGGQLQRVAIARALILKPAFIACDEITSAVDPQLQEQLLGMLQIIQKNSGVSFLFSTHNLLQTRGASHRTYVLYNGRVVEHGPSRSIVDTPYHPFTHIMVMAAKDPLRYAAEANAANQASSRVQKGCPFWSDCPNARQVCREELPSLQFIEHGREVACHFPVFESQNARPV